MSFRIIILVRHLNDTMIFWYTMVSCTWFNLKNNFNLRLFKNYFNLTKHKNNLDICGLRTQKELKDGLDILNWRFLELRVVAKTFEGSVTNCRNVKNHILSKYLWFSQVQFFKKSIFIRARLPRSSTYQWYFLTNSSNLNVYVTNSNICHHLMFPNFSGFLPYGMKHITWLN